MFGIEMGDYIKEPVLLIKTCWGGHSRYGNFRPPSAGRPAYESGCKPDEIGATYHKMVKEVRECLANLDTDFPQLKGLKTELCGFVWFQGWNDMCQPGDQIRQQVYDEYCPNFVHLVQDLCAEFKVPNLPVVCQKQCPPAPASIIMSLEAVFAAIAGYLVLNQILTGRAIIGCFLILLGVLMAQLVPMMRKVKDPIPANNSQQP
jgi:hypothetical protein